jgi:hypothetical protein
VPQSCCKPDYDAFFDEGMARRELEDYRQKGARGETRKLIEALVAEGVEGATLLDIGGGVGIIQHELLAAGAVSSVDVDASQPYLAAARLEAERRGYGDRAEHRHGDFVELADEVEPAAVVTLDRVICCYADMPALVASSVAHARRLYGLVYPVDRWWMRVGAAIMNAGLRLFRQSFRFHVHPTRSVDGLVRAAGFVPRISTKGWIWQVWVYARAA